MKPLSAHKITKLAQENGLEIYGSITTETKFPGGRETTANLSVFFNPQKPQPVLWEKLMTTTLKPGTEICVEGTRTSHPSGAIDGTLLPKYGARLKRVNNRRAKLGLNPISP